MFILKPINDEKEISVIGLGQQHIWLLEGWHHSLEGTAVFKR